MPINSLKSQLGADHPNVVTSLNNLAALYESQGRYSEAEPHYLRSLAIRLEKLGENHPYTQSTQMSLILLRLQIATGMDTDSLTQLLQTNPDAIIELLQQITHD